MVELTLTVFDVPALGSTSFKTAFVIDTGAGDSCLQPRDSIGLARIPFESLIRTDLWPLIEERSGVGGPANYFVTTCRYDFEHEDGSRTALDGVIAIAELTDPSTRIPSFLGRDVLQHFDLCLSWPERRIDLT